MEKVQQNQTSQEKIIDKAAEKLAEIFVAQLDQEYKARKEEAYDG